MASPVLDVQRLGVRYANGHEALRHASLAVPQGELVVILGSNGCGKSTLLKAIVGLAPAHGGSVRVDDLELTTLPPRQMRRARMPVAMIFQQAHLVRRRSVLANVATGALGHHRGLGVALGMLPKAELPRARAHLDEVDMAAFAYRRAGNLSGGQAQRVSIARALAQRPRVLLADEPVASLDPEAAEDIMALLRRLASADRLAILCVLHQPDLAMRYADRVVGLRHGQVAFDMPPAAVTAERLTELYARDVP